ncbi:MAG: dethiobiotin synthase [Rhodospirillales bacterium]|nr:dethiobiotin synthase [Rhodospirillales bacterium]
MKTFFITATGTGVGKTYVTAALVADLADRGRSVRVLKPVISGFDETNPQGSDTAVLLRSLGQPLTPEAIDACSPWRFSEPLSPDMAARHEGRAIDFAALVEFCRGARAGDEDVLLIEAVGGAMVPLDDSHTVLDWMADLGAPVVVVAGSYLGTLSHTLTTVSALRERDIDIAAVVVDESEDSPVLISETVDTLARFLPGLTLISLMRNADRASIHAALEAIIGE